MTKDVSEPCQTSRMIRSRDRSGTTATSKMERFVIIVNDWLTIIQRPASYIALPLYILLFFIQFYSNSVFKASSVSLKNS